MTNLEITILGKYESIIFDLDGTIWDCYAPNGDSMGAYATVPPYNLLSENVAEDIEGNIIKLQDGIKKLLRLLDLDNKNLGVVSSGETEHRPFTAQPSVMLLKKFNIYRYFNLDIVLKKDINKKDYVRPLGRTLFIDDTEEIIDKVRRRDKVDVLLRGAFKSWESLLDMKTSSKLVTSGDFIIDAFIELYEIEPIYSEITRKIKWGEEVTDSENLEYLKAKEKLPSLFISTIEFLKNTISDTLDWERRVPREDRGELRNQDQAQLKLIIDLTNRLKDLIKASRYVDNIEQWPYIFIAIDNTLNTIHLDFPYFMHLVWTDLEDIEDDDITENSIDKKWMQLAEILKSQGKEIEDVEDVRFIQKKNSQLPKGEDYSDYEGSQDIHPLEIVDKDDKGPRGHFRPNDESIYENELHNIDLREAITERPLTPFGKLAWRLEPGEINTYDDFKNLILDAEVNVRYKLPGFFYTSFEVDYNDDYGYSWGLVINYDIAGYGGSPIFPGNSNSITFWKTVNGAKRHLINYVADLFDNESGEYLERWKNKRAGLSILSWQIDDLEKLKSLDYLSHYITDTSGVVWEDGVGIKELEKVWPEFLVKYRDDVTIHSGKHEMFILYSTMENVIKKYQKSAVSAKDEPTDAQIEAGNYKKKHVKKEGLDISIENEDGSTRSGTDKDGNKWSIKMKNDYGYIKGTVGKDKDHLDCFLANEYKKEMLVFIVNQTDDKGKFDEHKVMLGFETREDAEKGYLDNYEKGWDNYDDIVEMSMGKFKEWSTNKIETKKPAEVAEKEASLKLTWKSTTETLQEKPIFICLWTPPEICSKLSNIEGLEEELHVTLIYRPALLQTDEKNRQLLTKIADIAKTYKGITCRYGGIASFSNEDKATVALIDIVEGPELFIKLIEAVESVYEPWDRKFGFTSHLTIHSEGKGKLPNVEPFSWEAKHIGITFGSTKDYELKNETIQYIVALDTGKIEETLEKKARITSLSWAQFKRQPSLLSSGSKTHKLLLYKVSSIKGHGVIPLTKRSWKTEYTSDEYLFRLVKASPKNIGGNVENIVYGIPVKAYKDVEGTRLWALWKNTSEDAIWWYEESLRGYITPGHTLSALEILSTGYYDVTIEDDRIFEDRVKPKLSWQPISRLMFASPETYMSDSGININKEEFEDRAKTFHIDEALTIDNQVGFPYGGHDEGHFVSLNIPMENEDNKSKKVLNLSEN